MKTVDAPAPSPTAVPAALDVISLHVPPRWLDTELYPFAHHDLKLSTGRMHYVDEGHGAPILFVHGTPSWSFEFRNLIRALAPSHRCIAPDLLGFGLSERPRCIAYTPEAHTIAITEFVDRLGLRDLTLVVHDYGGPIGLPLAFDRRGLVRRVAVINSWLWPLDDDPSIGRLARIAGSWLGKLLYREIALPLVAMPHEFGDRNRLSREIYEQYRAPFASPSARALVLWPLARALVHAHDYFTSLEQRSIALEDIPMTIVWGTADRLLRRHILDRWRTLLPFSAVTEVARAGHWPHEEEPDLVVDAIRDLLRR